MARDADAQRAIGGGGVTYTLPAFLQQSDLLPWAADLETLILVISLQNSGAARDRFLSAGLSHVDFPCELSREMMRELLAGGEMSAEVRAVFIRDQCGQHSWAGSLKMIRKLAAAGIMPALDPVEVVDQFITRHAEKQLSQTLRWAADRFDAGELSSKDRREIDSVMDAAGVTA